MIEAFDPGPIKPGAGGVVGFVLGLFAWLSQRNTADTTAVLGFNAREYKPSDAPEQAPAFVSVLTREQTDAACPRHGYVQSTTTAIGAEVVAESDYRSPQEYGTFVHKRLADSINGPGGYQFPRDPNFRAELSLSKSEGESYGTKDTIRVDVLENVRNGTVCVYDIKTGNRGLDIARMNEIAFNVNRYYPGTQRVIVIETRPLRTP